MPSRLLRVPCNFKVSQWVGRRHSLCRRSGCPSRLIKQNVRASVVVEIADGQAAPDDGALKVRACQRRHLFQTPVPRVVKQLRKLGVIRRAVGQFDVVYGVTVGNRDVGQTIIVVIQKLHAEAHVVDGGLPDPRVVAGVHELTGRVLPVQACRLMLVRGDDQGGLAVRVEIGPIYAHARVGRAGHVVGRAAHQAHVLKKALAFVMVQVAGRLIVGDGEIHPSVAIVIAHRHAQRVAVRVRQSSLHGFVCKCSIPIVVIQRTDFRIVGGRATGRLHARLIAILRAVGSKTSRSAPHTDRAARRCPRPGNTRSYPRVCFPDRPAASHPETCRSPRCGIRAQQR